MKILHTADWHIGKKLHKHELSEDFDLFINWLVALIKEENIEVLLIAGDIFDLANPSSEARKQYYRALLKLKQLNCKIIATGGNHDSPAMLDAPGEILRELDMHVIGGFPENAEQMIISVGNKNAEPELLVVAIPFLRDADLRKKATRSYDDRLEAIREGIAGVFKAAATICKKQHPQVPVIAMGHLYAAGSETSDSERDIQIGNLAGFQAKQFGEYFNYIALGHIHKPQRITANIPVYYSGSPIPLSFSERKDEKRVLLIDTEKGFTPKSIKIPVFRKLLKVSGTLDELQLKLNKLEKQSELNSLIEVELREDQYDANKIYRLDELVTNFSQPGFEIVKHRANFNKKLSGASELYQENQQLEDLNPGEVFQELIKEHEYDEATKNDIVSAFNEILQEVQQQENP